jgi:hypothetical protein
MITLFIMLKTLPLTHDVDTNIQWWWLGGDTTDFHRMSRVAIKSIGNDKVGTELERLFLTF